MLSRHPSVLFTLASLGFLAAACSSGDTDRPVFESGGATATGGTSGTAEEESGTGGSVVSPGTGGTEDTGGSGGEENSGGTGGAMGGMGGSTGGTGGSTGGTGGTGGSTGGTGGSTGGTGGTGTGPLPCSGTPATCADLGATQEVQYYGCCDGNNVYWCDDQSGAWELHGGDCATMGGTCDYDPSYDGMWCVTEPVEPVEPGDPPGAGPGPSCSNLPPMDCTGGAAHCAALVQFNPVQGDGYIDYPENGETWANQYRSYIRRDLMMLIQYATAKVACKTAGWTTGNGKPLGLIDMSEANGAIPGTSIGSPGHPAGTHVNGRDIDVAYYQTANIPDNRARAICEHVVNGKDAYHCVAEPHLLDAWRNAAFLGFLFESKSVRVVGADGKVGPHLDAALTYLCQNGWLTTYACSNRKLTYEVTNQGHGWYYFHHHHMHVSYTPPTYTSSVPMSLDPTCLIESCDAKAWSAFLGSRGLTSR